MARRFIMKRSIKVLTLLFTMFSCNIYAATWSATCDRNNANVQTCCNPEVTTCASGTIPFTAYSGSAAGGGNLPGNSSHTFAINCGGTGDNANSVIWNVNLTTSGSDNVASASPSVPPYFEGTQLPATTITIENDTSDTHHVYLKTVECGYMD